MREIKSNLHNKKKKYYISTPKKKEKQIVGK
jgi:hypothetical protein